MGRGGVSGGGGVGSGSGTFSVDLGTSRAMMRGGATGGLGRGGGVGGVGFGSATWASAGLDSASTMFTVIGPVETVVRVSRGLRMGMYNSAP